MAKWQGHTDGTPWMQELLIGTMRWLPLWLFYVAVAAVVPFYLLFAKSTQSSYLYFRKRLQWGRLRAALACYRQYYRFGQVVIDRFAAYANKKFCFVTENLEPYTELEQAPAPFMIFNAHMGSYEMAGYFFVAQQKPFNNVIYGAETATIMKYRTAIFARTHIRLIPVEADFSHIFAINRAIQNGEIISIAADRNNGSDRALLVDFLGAPAYFPLGPFALALQRELPTMVLLVLRDGYKRYRLIAKRLPLPSPTLPRAERLQKLANSYVQVLEQVLQRYPEQWFNFFDIWQVAV